MVKVINIDTQTKTIRISNAEDGDIKTWRTTESGTHFPIREGESTKEALDKFVDSKEKAPKASGKETKQQRERAEFLLSRSSYSRWTTEWREEATALMTNETTPVKYVKRMQELEPSVAVASPKASASFINDYIKRKNPISDPDGWERLSHNTGLTEQQKAKIKAKLEKVIDALENDEYQEYTSWQFDWEYKNGIITRLKSEIKALSLSPEAQKAALVGKQKAEKTATQLKEALNTVFNKRTRDSIFHDSLKFDTQYEDGGIVLSIRDLGDWEVSDDDRYDPDHEGEDFDDWDWKQPTAETHEKIVKVLKDIEAKTGVHVGYNAGEKNWAYFYIPTTSE